MFRQMNSIESKLVPRLRFPEFVNDEEWKEKCLGDVSEIITGNTPSTIEPEYYGGERMFVSPADIDYKRYITQTKTTLTELGFSKTRIIKTNSVLFVCIGSTIGKVAQNKFECATNQQLNSLVPYDEYSSDFIYSLLEENSKKIAMLAGKQAVPIINKTLFSSVSLLFPKKLEQKKIAACLSSLDKVITAESQKLDLLQEHKKGLLQILFPQKGETSPKFRFKEFEDCGGWKEKELGKICKMQAGKFVSASEIKENYLEDLFPCYGGNGLRGYTKSYTHSGKYSLIGRQGALCGNVTLADGTFHATEHAVVVTPEKHVDTVWLYYMLGYLNLNQYATGQAQPGLSVTNIEKVELMFPNSIQEQQKIADTLSSIDELINAQSQKLEVLKLQKKGLLQGFFPTTANQKITNAKL